LLDVKCVKRRTHGRLVLIEIAVTGLDRHRPSIISFSYFAEKLEDGQECVPAVYRQAVGAEQESATPLNNRELHYLKMVEAAGIEPIEIKSTTDTTAPHFAANASQNNALQHLTISTKKLDSTAPLQNHNDSQQQICVPDVYENPLPKDLAHVMACWPRLPDNLKRKILALLRHH